MRAPWCAIYKANRFMGLIGRVVTLHVTADVTYRMMTKEEAESPSAVASATSCCTAASDRPVRLA
jgi:hypothetical protein